MAILTAKDNRDYKANFRYCFKGHGDDSLTDKEKADLDYGIGILPTRYVLTTLTKKEWNVIKSHRQTKKQIAALTKKEWDHLKVIREIKLLD